MSECTKDGCTKKAKHRVTFENPEEVLEYCDHCAMYEYKNQSNAINVKKGLEND